MQFENACVKTKQCSIENDNSKGKRMVLKCDTKSKEAPIKFKEECKNESVCVRGNIGIKFRDTYLSNYYKR